MKLIYRIKNEALSNQIYLLTEDEQPSYDKLEIREVKRNQTYSLTSSDIMIDWKGSFHRSVIRLSNQAAIYRGNCSFFLQWDVPINDLKTQLPDSAVKFLRNETPSEYLPSTHVTLYMNLLDEEGDTEYVDLTIEEVN